SVTFVAEGHDYWAFVFEHDPDYVAERYSEWTRTKVTQKELRAASDVDLCLVDAHGRLHNRGRLLSKNDFNWRNQLNQGPGIVHLSHRANALTAEVALADTSALPRHDAAGDPVV